MMSAHTFIEKNLPRPVRRPELAGDRSWPARHPQRAAHPDTIYKKASPPSSAWYFLDSAVY